jgi:hypothetical protein
MQPQSKLAYAVKSKRASTSHSFEAGVLIRPMMQQLSIMMQSIINFTLLTKAGEKTTRPEDATHRKCVLVNDTQRCD